MTSLGWVIAVLALGLGAGAGYLLGRRTGTRGDPANLESSRLGERSGVDSPAHAEPPEAIPTEPILAPPPRHRLLGPFPLGIAAGLLFVAVVGGLASWITGTDSASPPEIVAVAAETPPPQQAGPLSPALAELDQHILAHPDDLDARREMALMLLSENRFMDALGQADQILTQQAGDPTALYVQGIVRLNMGQRQRGRSLLEQALETDPAHVHSLIALARLHLQEGRRDDALTVLQTALQAAGGRHPGIERLIAEAQDGR